MEINPLSLKKGLKTICLKNQLLAIEIILIMVLVELVKQVLLVPSVPPHHQMRLLQVFMGAH
jgi:hypothetical protein